MSEHLTEDASESVGHNKECDSCGNEFRVDNGALISDFAYHRLRGCSGGEV